MNLFARPTLLVPRRPATRKVIGIAATLWIFGIASSCLVDVEPSKTSSDDMDETGKKNKKSKKGSGKKSAKQGGSSDHDDDSSAPDKKSSKGKKSAKGSDKPDGNDKPGTKKPDPGKCEVGRERACTEGPDGNLIHYPGGVVLGSCKVGIKTCQKNGTWSACKGAVGPKKMDTCEAGNDDNCNGRPNDHCTCKAGQSQPCGTNTGICEKGEMHCQNDGSWGKCEGEVGPKSFEICDGLNDDNCNGISDQNECTCINGRFRPCGDHFQGLCRRGEEYCVDNGRWSGECEGEIKPRPEICDGLHDENCNGLSDQEECECINDRIELCDIPGGIGDCRLGIRSCRDGKWSYCEPRFPQTQESCNSRYDQHGQATGDEDCDGSINEHNDGYPPLGCLDYMQDLDKDGYGAEGVPTKCFCEGNIQTGYVRATSKAGTDCGDCDRAYSGGWSTHPDRQYGSDQPSECARYLGKLLFDYNCDGREVSIKKGGNEVVRCVGDNESACRNIGGRWLDSVPACGESQKTGDCRWKDSKCEPTLDGGDMRQCL